jgi:hypothetical protein
VSDAKGYSKLSYPDQLDLQKRMADILDQAAINARLDRRQGDIQVGGDGDLTAWPPGTNELNLIADYVRELARELNRVNLTLSEGSRLRLRLAISAGLVDVGPQGPTGQAPITASVLANSDELRAALRDHPDHSLVVIIDDTLYQDVVASGLAGLRAEDYRRVVIKDKYGTKYVAWITVPGTVPSGANAGGGGALPAAAPQPATLRHSVGPAPFPANAAWNVRWPFPIQITVALIGAAAVILAALIAIMPSLFGISGDSPTRSALPPASGVTHTAMASSATTSPPASPSSTSPSPGLHLEEAYNHRGTQVFRDPQGDAATAGPAYIQFGTEVWVKCWASNESTEGSINAFYLVESAPWAGEYAPANTFLNADTTGTLDPEVHQCPSS